MYPLGSAMTSDRTVATVATSAVFAKASGRFSHCAALTKFTSEKFQPPWST